MNLSIFRRGYIFLFWHNWGRHFLSSLQLGKLFNTFFVLDNFQLWSKKNCYDLHISKITDIKRKISECTFANYALRQNFVQGFRQSIGTWSWTLRWKLPDTGFVLEPEDLSILELNGVRSQVMKHLAREQGCSHSRSNCRDIIASSCSSLESLRKSLIPALAIV